MKRCPSCGGKMSMVCGVGPKKCYWMCGRCNKVVPVKDEETTPMDARDVLGDDHRTED